MARTHFPPTKALYLLGDVEQAAQMLRSRLTDYASCFDEHGRPYEDNHPSAVERATKAVEKAEERLTGATATLNTLVGARGARQRTLTATPETCIDGTFTFSFQTVKGNLEDFGSARFAVKAETAWFFALNLIGILRIYADTQMRNAYAGDCERCGNLRMISEMNRHGRMENKHCPECHERWASAEAAFPVLSADSVEAAS